MKKSKKLNQLLINLLFVVLAAVFIYPFLLLVSVSFSNETDIINNGYKLIPEHFTLSAYKYLFSTPHQIIQSYKVTTFTSVVGTFLSILLQAMIAFPISRRSLRGRRGISFFLYFTMLFSGGMVASYIFNTQVYHLGNTIWVYILPGLVSPWNIFMMRTYFQGLPDEMFEAIRVDGGNAYTQFFKFALPLSKPVLATLAFTTFLGKWNDWNTALLYIDNDDLISLQYLLQRILNNIDLIKEMSMNGMSDMVSVRDIPSETVRMAMAIVVSGPTLVIFPFFQKYFVRGLTVGAVKG